MASGRFVNKSIAEDDRLARISILAEYVFLKTIPHLDRDGMITGKPSLLFSRTHPTRDDLYGKTQTFIDEWVAASLVILFNTVEGPVLFFPGFAKNNKLPHYERETPSRFPPPPGYARDGKDGPLYPAHQKPPSQTPKKPKQGKAPADDTPTEMVHMDKVQDFDMDEVMDEVQELLQDKVQDELHDLADEVLPKAKQSKVKQDQDQDQVKEKINTNTNARALVTFALPLMLPEWNGGGAYLESLNDEKLLIAAGWLWLYQKLKGSSDYARNDFADQYPISPFAGITNPSGFIRKKVEERALAPLKYLHREQMMAELKTLQVTP